MCALTHLCAWKANVFPSVFEVLLHGVLKWAVSFQKHNQAQLQARQQHPNSNATNSIRKGLPLAVGGSTSNATASASVSKVGVSTLTAKQAASIQAVQRQLVSAGASLPTTSITTTSTSASSSSPVAIITNLSVGSTCREVGAQCSARAHVHLSFNVLFIFIFSFFGAWL